MMRKTTNFHRRLEKLETLFFGSPRAAAIAQAYRTDSDRAADELLRSYFCPRGPKSPVLDVWTLTDKEFSFLRENQKCADLNAKDLSTATAFLSDLSSAFCNPQK